MGPLGPGRRAVPTDLGQSVRRAGQFQRMGSASTHWEAGGWGTPQSPETRPLLGRSPPVSRSCDVYQSVWARRTETFVALGKNSARPSRGRKPGARALLAQAARTADERPAPAGGLSAGEFQIDHSHVEDQDLSHRCPRDPGRSNLHRTLGHIGTKCRLGRAHACAAKFSRLSSQNKGNVHEPTQGSG